LPPIKFRYDQALSLLDGETRRRMDEL